MDMWRKFYEEPVRIQKEYDNPRKPISELLKTQSKGKFLTLDEKKRVRDYEKKQRSIKRRKR